MTKRMISRIWVIGFVVFVAGLLVGGISLGLMLAYGGHYVPAASGNGYDFIPRLDGYFWTTVGLMIAGFVGAGVGGIVQMVAWVGALISTYQLEDKTWFAVLLAGGLLGLSFGPFGIAAMVAYLIAGPEGTARREPPAMAPREWPATVAHS